jgi:hypothetical protein
MRAIAVGPKDRSTIGQSCEQLPAQPERETGKVIIYNNNRFVLHNSFIRLKRHLLLKVRHIVTRIIRKKGDESFPTWVEI